MHKKILLVTGILLMALIALSACSQTSSPTSPVTTAPAPVSSAAPKPVTSAPAAPVTSAAPAPTASTAPVSPSAPAAGTPKRGGTLRFADNNGPLDIGWPADATFTIGGHALSLFMDTMLSGDNNGNINPCLCTAYKISDDLKSITLTLRQGVKFHDGSDWNATAAKWNLDQLISAKLGNYANFDSVDAVDNNTIKINLKTYTNTLLTALAETRVVSKTAFDAHGKDWMFSNVVGTGPFKMVSFQPKVSIKGTRFDDYWQKGKPYLDGVEFNLITDAFTKATALKAKEEDLIGGDLSKVEYDLEQAGYKLTKGYISVYCLLPDSKTPSSPLANPKVRQAVDYAIDRDSIVKSLGYGYWASTYQFALPGTPAYIKDLPPRAYNQDKAKQLLTEAGYASGFSTTISVDSFVSNNDAVTAMQAQLAKVGIKVNLTVADMGTAQSLFSKGWVGWMGTARAISSNPNFAFVNFTKDSPIHVSVDKTDAFYTLYQASLTSKNYDPQLAQKVVQYMYDNSMINPFYAVSRGCVMQPNVRDTGLYTRSSFWFWEPADTWLDK